MGVLGQYNVGAAQSTFLTSTKCGISTSIPIQTAICKTCKHKRTAKMKLTVALGIVLSSLPFVTPGACPRPKPRYQACGGMVARANQCPENYRCISDPRTGGCGLACDEPGICVPETAPPCGGFPGTVGPQGKGYVCYDDPTDGCDPEMGGADCSGICLKKDRRH